MVNRPDQDMQGVHSPARKLALPEPPNAGQQRRRYSSPRPARSINQQTSAAPHGLFTRMLHRLRTDRSFAILSASIALVVIVSIVLISLGVSAVNAGNNGPVWNKAMVQHPAVPSPTGTIDLKPTFPTPGSKKGSTTSSQPTPGTQPTQTDPTDQGTLNVQIVNVPNVVNNQAQVRVQVQTSEPNVNVRLEVTYSALPFNYTSRAGTTNGNGNTTLVWSVRVRSFNNGNNVRAILVVIATDRNGQQATSDPITVEVTP
ncbi:MAG TPA: hypothetical protein VHD63_14650 [Ktedonobacteraceae bacterium]|nr:hypothetical protein [Ktedonobacteraceae bacterium]